MKTAIIFFILFFSAHHLLCQTTDNKVDANSMIGQWYLPYHAKQPWELVFEKAKENTMRWGNYITILENGELVVGHSAPCGNDPNRFRNSGTWKYNAKSRKITFSLDVHEKGKVFYVKMASVEKMILI